MTGTPERSSADGVIARVPAVAVALTVAAFLACQVYELDIWWHLAIGEDIVRTGTVPGSDRYSVLGLGRPYHDSHWLFQVAAAGAHRALGWVGIQSLVALAWGAALVLCHRVLRRGLEPATAALVLLLIAVAGVERFLPRPELATMVGIALFGERLSRSTIRTRDTLILTAYQVLWSNCHGLFVLGPLLAGAWFAERAFTAGPDRRRGALLAAVCAATLVTPFPLDGWWYASVLLLEAGGGGPEVMQRLGELSPTLGEASRSGLAFWGWAGVVILAAVGAARAVRTRRIPPGSLAALGLLVASLMGRRNMPLFALAAAPFLATQLADLALTDRLRGRVAAVLVALPALLLAAVPLSGAYYERMGIPSGTGLGVTPSFFPHGWADFLRTSGIRGGILASNELGGFVSHHGFPDVLPLTDGRWEVQDPDALEAALTLAQTGGGWQLLVEQHALQGVLLGHGSDEARAILPEISASPGWRPVYVDAAASFWLPATHPAAQHPVPLDRLPPIVRPADGVFLDAFLRVTAPPAVRIENLTRTLALGAHRVPLLERLGNEQIAAELHGPAQLTFETLLDEDPGSRAARNELAFLAYRKGDLETATRHMEAALRDHPGDRELLANLERIRRAAHR